MKKNILFIVAILFSLSSATAQTLVAERVSDLMPAIYQISGDGILEEFSDGSLTLTLSSDFSTPAGPDVRILLSNSLSLTNAVEVVNLSDINHFNGEITFDVPSGIGIDDFSNILFFCVQFNQFWASGEFGSTVVVGGNNCQDSSVSSTGGDNIDICATDGATNIINFSNSLNASAGDNYAYLITDENELLQEVVLNNSFDFEGSSSETQRVYGISYAGELSPIIGANRSQTSASDCFTHSDGTFLTITKDGCSTSGYECMTTVTATTNWATEVAICPTDGMDDELELRNNLSIPIGTNYAFLITDENEIVQEAVFTNFYNFEDSGMEIQRVYGVNFDGTLNVQIGQHRAMTTATGCFEHSGDNLFLTVLKSGGCLGSCLESATATENWVTSVDICSTDGNPDEVLVKNNLFIAPGDSYVFLITDANEILQEVLFDSLYNFEGTGTEEQRIYGLSYAGQLSPAVGEHRLNTNASVCATHSNANLFLTINKTAACLTAVNDVALSALVEVYPNPASNLLNIKVPESFVPERVFITNMLGVTVWAQTVDIVDNIQLDIPDLSSGSYVLRIENEQQAVNQIFQIVK